MREKFYEASPVDDLISGEAERIALIKGTLRLDVGHFDAYFMPVLNAYASYVHLLPASEHHHHGWPGGLFSHGVEVALGSVRGSRKYLYGHHEVPRLKDTIEERWRLGVTLAGLLHDAGKAFAGIEVSSDSGLMWNPHVSSLTEWLLTHKIKKYRVKWRKGRDAEHDSVCSSILIRMIPQSVINHLTEHGGEIWHSITQTTARENKDERFGALVKAADQWSVSMDLQFMGINSDDSGARERPEKVILRTMRKLVSNSVWQWNSPGSRLWHIDGAVYIVWRAAVQDLVKGFHEDAITGFDFDAENMADLLVERGIAQSCPDKDGKQTRYWRIPLPGIEKTPYLLRLEDGVSICDELPTAIDQDTRPRLENAKKRSYDINNEELKDPVTAIVGISEGCLQLLDPLMRGNDLRLIRKTPDGLFIRHRESARHLGMEASVFLDIIVKESIHQCDPRYPMKPVREINGDVGLLLTPNASKWLESHFGLIGNVCSPNVTRDGMSLNTIMNGTLSGSAREKVAERLASKKTKSYGVYDAK
ncbi:MAG: hypothetical protein EBT06_00050 [Gammaproteobacteria bacterium]|nr:hypothetical protein [Gammaproteobacteria bacterium]NBT43316.1 hypothetical protein [Gammaproteobacteria bacterium]NBY21378.1 hypothetical protein [Gammaproteobacteria bacterium]